MTLTPEGARKALMSVLPTAQVRRDPWTYATTDPLPAEICASMQACFDAADLVRVAAEREEKPYRFSHASFPRAEPGARASWQTVADVLLGAEYKREIARLSGTKLEGAEAHLDLWEYGPGDFLGAHLDKSEKLVTQIIYLCAGETAANGGRLLLLRSADKNDVFDSVVPRMGGTAILVRSHISWHAVEPLGEGSGRRRSITLTYRIPNAAEGSRAVRCDRRNGASERRRPCSLQKV